ncbi:hypothetical protein [Planctomyces sp. SH-PL14]|uniref:hypothetical protein n=1 Tax=Planctomyces sp. SH-PL14 TaxID=1632864 RepID=UPI00078D436F|nr:hypothetical protein [Planctomyces sp. SH-PL14]AMV18424.1 hypothetical protein VT03_11070 [Planctomyces sp. SH-PL14]
MNTAPHSASMLVVFCRIFWMLFGPLLFALSLYHVATASGGGFRPADACCLALAAALPIARWIESFGGDPRTATGDPVTRGEIWRYTWIAGGGGLWLWITTRAILLLIFDH